MRAGRRRCSRAARPACPSAGPATDGEWCLPRRRPRTAVPPPLGWACQTMWSAVPSSDGSDVPEVTGEGSGAVVGESAVVQRLRQLRHAVAGPSSDSGIRHRSMPPPGSRCVTAGSGIGTIVSAAARSPASACAASAPVSRSPHRRWRLSFRRSPSLRSPALQELAPRRAVVCRPHVVVSRPADCGAGMRRWGKVRDTWVQCCGMVTISPVRARCGLRRHTLRVCGVAWARSDKQRTHSRLATGERTHHRVVRPTSTRASDSPLLRRPTTSPSGPGLTVPGESEHHWTDRESEGPSWRCARGRSAPAGPCGRERVMTR